MPNAIHNLPPPFAMDELPCPESSSVKYLPESQVILLHDAIGPMLVQLTKLETALQLLRAIVLMDERMPELAQPFVKALRKALMATFNASLHEIGRGRNRPCLCWNTKKMYVR